MSIDDKTKYLGRLAFYFDLIKTSAHFEICAYARINYLLGKAWVPAATNLRISTQLFHRHAQDCDDLDSEYKGEYRFWGGYVELQTNIWNEHRATQKASFTPSHSYSATGFWGGARVKNMDRFDWDPLQIL